MGVLNAIDGVEHDVLGAVTPGDSGGPVGNGDRRQHRLGIVNTVGVGANTDASDGRHGGRGRTTSTSCSRTRPRAASCELRTVGG